MSTTITMRSSEKNTRRLSDATTPLAGKSMSDQDEPKPTEETLNVVEQVIPNDTDHTTSGLYERKIAWAIISAAILIYLIAFPLRVLYYDYDFTTRILTRLRPWVPVREIWYDQIKDLPDFGSKLGLQIAFVACLIAIVAAVIYGLWLILVQSETEQPTDGADAI
jgi:hypothetical protein